MKAPTDVAKAAAASATNPAVVSARRCVRRRVSVVVFMGVYGFFGRCRPGMKRNCPAPHGSGLPSSTPNSGRGDRSSQGGLSLIGNETDSSGITQDPALVLKA